MMMKGYYTESSKKWREFNKKNIADLPEQKMIKHCHTEEANLNRAETLRDYMIMFTT
jgi:hypothetical protein